MKIFLDTANLEEIKKYNNFGIVDGVTTNPSLIAKEGVSLEQRIKEIVKVVNGPISSEVVVTDYDGMVKQGLEYAKWHKNIVVKLPMTPDGIRACKTLADQGIRVNMTLIFSPLQAVLAAKAGAYIVSPFIGRLDDIGSDGMILIGEIVEIFNNYQFETQVLTASIRHPRQVADAARLGTDIVTMPTDVLDKMFHHPLTDLGLKKFMDDYAKLKK